MYMYLFCHSCWAKRFAQPAAAAVAGVPSANDSLTWLPLPYSTLSPTPKPSPLCSPCAAPLQVATAPPLVSYVGQKLV